MLSLLPLLIFLTSHHGSHPGVSSSLKWWGRCRACRACRARRTRCRQRTRFLCLRRASSSSWPSRDDGIASLVSPTRGFYPRRLPRRRSRNCTRAFPSSLGTISFDVSALMAKVAHYRPIGCSREDYVSRVIISVMAFTESGGSPVSAWFSLTSCNSKGRFWFLSHSRVSQG